MFSGSLSVMINVDREVSYAEAEEALANQGFRNCHINRLITGSGSTELLLSAHLPRENVTADVVVKVPAADALRRMAAAVEELELAIYDFRIKGA